ncbi:hypothetical protein PIB30_091134 [Stylosanthes scabra]|uniref:Uncharacterized protein n=1 Tax=Stylosanthes scabra TaxID=79078 RepID=A0ABU6RUD8_9FABA|nr:hypothetical protein [Stylosanthes scabra]
MGWLGIREDKIGEAVEGEAAQVLGRGICSWTICVNCDSVEKLLAEGNQIREHMKGGEAELGISYSLGDDELSDCSSKFDMTASSSDEDGEFVGRRGEKRHCEEAEIPEGGTTSGEGGWTALVSAADFVGKVFENKEKAYNAYKEFTLPRGFGVRKGDVGRSEGVIVWRNFFYHRQGRSSAKHYDRVDRVSEGGEARERNGLQGIAEDRLRQS